MNTIHDREWSPGFSDKEKHFLLRFAQTGEMELSAKAAGYSDSSLAWIGDRILSKEGPRIELATIKQELGIGSGTMTQEDIVEEFKIIGQASIADFYDELGNVKDISDIDPTKARAIKEIKRTVNPKNGHVTTILTMHDKISALQNLGRIGGHYAADNGQQQGDINIQIVAPGGLSKL